jgi:hypothetical protein
VQGLAFLVTFCAIAKSDWPPRGHGAREWRARLVVRAEPMIKLNAVGEHPLTLTLSREGRGDKPSAALRALV